MEMGRRQYIRLIGVLNLRPPHGLTQYGITQLAWIIRVVIAFRLPQKARLKPPASPHNSDIDGFDIVPGHRPFYSRAEEANQICLTSSFSGPAALDRRLLGISPRRVFFRNYCFEAFSPCD